MGSQNATLSKIGFAHFLAKALDVFCSSNLKSKGFTQNEKNPLRQASFQNSQLTAQINDSAPGVQSKRVYFQTPPVWLAHIGVYLCVIWINLNES